MQFKSFASIAVGVAAVFIVSGCAKGNDQSSTTTTTTATVTTASPGAQATLGDSAHGKAIFSAKCAVCHGATGTEGGVGPSLKGEKNKKNTDQTIAWIHNPQPPMPKLWPTPLNDKDVVDVTAYVQGL